MKVHKLSIVYTLLVNAITSIFCFVVSTSLLSAESSLEDYQQRINMIQKSIGPYSEELIQPTLQMGLILHENNQFSDANERLESALYLHRVNYGLQDLQQSSIVDLLISNNLNRQDWKSADNNFHKLHWLHRRNLDSNDPELLAVLDRLIAWHLVATNLKTGQHPGKHFMKLLELNQRALEIVDNYPVQDQLELSRRLYKLALVHYYIAIAVQRGDSVGRYLLEEFDPIQLSDSYETASEKTALKMFRKSRQLIVRIVSLHQDIVPATKDSRAIAQLYLADWDLLFNRHANANRGYQNSYDILLERGYSSDLINSFFDQPILLPKSEFIPDLMTKYALQYEKNEIPETGTMEFVGWSKSLPGVKYPTAEINNIVSASTERFADVSFDVLKDGLAKNIVIGKHKRKSGLPRRTTYEAIWSAQFRPRLIEGRAVAVSGVTTRFYMPSIENK
ncbi:MAG: hypothetical protein GKR93_09215 [Gammaproteobacteria bacterium]|nr:hypothetical protein [Gammaproteobacteria bacterium]